MVARNQAALLLRRRGPATAPLESVSALGSRTGMDPAESAQILADLTTALEGPAGDVLRLMYVEDRPVAEVAAILGVPAGTVKSRVHRARRILRVTLGGTR